MKKKCMSAEEALTLLLKTSDQDTDAESDIDIISMQSPISVSPQAVKISSPDEINTTNAVYQNLKPSAYRHMSLLHFLTNMFGTPCVINNHPPQYLLHLHPLLPNV